MRAIVVSDVHLGYKLSDVKAFGKFIDDELAKNKPDKLILLGDIFDFWRRSDAELLLENQEIVGKLLRLEVPIVHVAGNHDYSILELSKRFPQNPGFEVTSSTMLSNSDSRFVLLHGYEIDVFVTMEEVGLDAYLAFSEAMCHAGNVGGTVADWIWTWIGCLSKIDKSVWPVLKSIALTPPEQRDLSKVDEFAKSTSRSIPTGLKANDVLVFGHTHNPFKADLTVNTGSWVMTEGKANHTYLEIADTDFHLLDWPVSLEAQSFDLSYKPPTSRKRHRGKKSGRH